MASTAPWLPLLPVSPSTPLRAVGSVATEIGTIRLGVCACSAAPEGEALAVVELPAPRHRDPRLDADALPSTGAVLDAATVQLREWFAGRRTTFDLPLAPAGTPFQLAVWSRLVTIPFGETRSYADIARAIGRPTAVRAVGAANGRNPLPIVVPCHRVIGRNGSLTGFAGGLDTKRYLLDLER
jgi:methylated-DNA-[protein]-cysteine S-methyltransferase